MEPAVESGEELQETFFRFGRFGGTRAKQLLEKGVHVTGNVRKDALVSAQQGRVWIEGRWEQIEFENLGGGVWRAYVHINSEE